MGSEITNPTARSIYLAMCNSVSNPTFTRDDAEYLVKQVNLFGRDEVMDIAKALFRDITIARPGDGAKIRLKSLASTKASASVLLGLWVEMAIRQRNKTSRVEAVEAASASALALPAAE